MCRDEPTLFFVCIWWGALLTFFVWSGHDAFLGVRYEVLKPRPPGEVAAIADVEGLFPVICGRTQFVPTVVLASY